MPCCQLLLWRKGKSASSKLFHSNSARFLLNRDSEEQSINRPQNQYGASGRLTRSRSSQDLSSVTAPRELSRNPARRTSSVFSSTSSVNEFYTPSSSPPEFDAPYLSKHSVLEYSQKLDTAFADVIDNSRSLGEWNYVIKKDEVSIYHRNIPGNPINRMKGIIEIPLPAKYVCDFILMKDRQKEWNDAIQETLCIEQCLSSAYSIDYTVYKAPWPVASRDFVFVSGSKLLADGTYVTAAISVDHPKFPEIPGRVRGELYGSGFFIEPVSHPTQNTFPAGKSPPNSLPDACRVSYVVQIDLKGWLAPSVVAKANLNQPLCLATLKQILLKSYAQSV